MGYTPPPEPPDDPPGYMLLYGAPTLVPAEHSPAGHFSIEVNDDHPKDDTEWWHVWVMFWLLIDLIAAGYILMRLPGANQ